MSAVGRQVSRGPVVGVRPPVVLGVSGVQMAASAAPGARTTVPTTPPSPVSAVVANMLVASSEARLRANALFVSDIVDLPRARHSRHRLRRYDPAWFVNRR